MKKNYVLMLAGIVMSGCSFLQGSLDPKVIMTCTGVKGSIEMTTSESKAFISDIKAGKTDGDICIRNAKFCEAAIKALANSKASCDVKPAL